MNDQAINSGLTPAANPLISQARGSVSGSQAKPSPSETAKKILAVALPIIAAIITAACVILTAVVTLAIPVWILPLAAVVGAVALAAGIYFIVQWARQKNAAAASLQPNSTSPQLNVPTPHSIIKLGQQQLIPPPVQTSPSPTPPQPPVQQAIHVPVAPTSPPVVQPIPTAKPASPTAAKPSDSKEKQKLETEAKLLALKLEAGAKHQAKILEVEEVIKSNIELLKNVTRLQIPSIQLSLINANEQLDALGLQGGNGKITELQTQILEVTQALKGCSSLLNKEVSIKQFENQIDLGRDTDKISDLIKESTELQLANEKLLNKYSINPKILQSFADSVEQLTKLSEASTSILRLETLLALPYSPQYDVDATDQEILSIKETLTKLAEEISSKPSKQQIADHLKMLNDAMAAADRNTNKNTFAIDKLLLALSMCKLPNAGKILNQLELLLNTTKESFSSGKHFSGYLQARLSPYISKAEQEFQRLQEFHHIRDVVNPCAETLKAPLKLSDIANLRQTLQQSLQQLSQIEKSAGQGIGDYCREELTQIRELQTQVEELQTLITTQVSELCEKATLELKQTSEQTILDTPEATLLNKIEECIKLLEAQEAGTIPQTKIGQDLANDIASAKEAQGQHKKIKDAVKIIHSHILAADASSIENIQVVLLELDKLSPKILMPKVKEAVDAQSKALREIFGIVAGGRFLIGKSAKTQESALKKVSEADLKEASGIIYQVTLLLDKGNPDFRSYLKAMLTPAIEDAEKKQNIVTLQVQKIRAEAYAKKKVICDLMLKACPSTGDLDKMKELLAKGPNPKQQKAYDEEVAKAIPAIASSIIQLKEQLSDLDACEAHINFPMEAQAKAIAALFLANNAHRLELSLIEQDLQAQIIQKPDYFTQNSGKLNELSFSVKSLLSKRITKSVSATLEGDFSTAQEHNAPCYKILTRLQQPENAKLWSLLFSDKNFRGLIEQFYRENSISLIRKYDPALSYEQAAKHLGHTVEAQENTYVYNRSFLDFCKGAYSEHIEAIKKFKTFLPNKHQELREHYNKLETLLKEVSKMELLPSFETRLASAKLPPLKAIAGLLPMALTSLLVAEQDGAAATLPASDDTSVALVPGKSSLNTRTVLGELLVSEKAYLTRINELIPVLEMIDSKKKISQYGGSKTEITLLEVIMEMKAITKQGHAHLFEMCKAINGAPFAAGLTAGAFPKTGQIAENLSGQSFSHKSLIDFYRSGTHRNYALQLAQYVGKFASRTPSFENFQLFLQKMNMTEEVSKMLGGKTISSILIDIVQRPPRWSLLTTEIVKQAKELETSVGNEGKVAIQNSQFGGILANGFSFAFSLAS